MDEVNDRLRPQPDKLVLGASGQCGATAQTQGPRVRKEGCASLNSFS
jgi:hypothetical protein